jgi:hypothetical protein
MTDGATSTPAPLVTREALSAFIQRLIGHFVTEQIILSAPWPAAMMMVMGPSYGALPYLGWCKQTKPQDQCSPGAPSAASAPLLQLLRTDGDQLPFEGLA